MEDIISILSYLNFSGNRFPVCKILIINQKFGMSIK